jgi:Hydrazine synthase alpha subunit middle domain
LIGLRSIVVCLALLLAASMVISSVHASPASNSFLYTVAKVYQPLAWMHGDDRFPSGATIFIHESSVHESIRSRALLPTFAASADPAVSFDGERILFAAKRKTGDPWQIWEMSLADGDDNARQITSGKDDCIRPLYLPGDRIVYAQKTQGRFWIASADLTGRNVLPLTYGPANFLPSDVLRDGRILFEAGYPLGSDKTPEIYTVYSDGSGVESYRCDHGKVHHQGRQLSSGDIVFASASGLSRFTSARAQEIAISTPAGDYAGDVTELSSGEWLLPWRADAKHEYQLVVWRPGSSAVHTVVVSAEANALEPLDLGARVVPNRHPSGLHDWPNANLLCLNAYTSKYLFPARSIHSARVYAQDSAGKARLLGTAPVESDGSFFVHVPSDRALQIELLDAAGKTLKRESGFFWMRRGEQRVCVGCHAGPETAPENAVPQILLRSTTPADMTGGEINSGGR